MKNSIVLENRLTEVGYSELERQIIEKFNEVQATNAPLYQAEITNLFDTYLNNLPEEHRQEFNCHTCKRFIRRFGNICVIVDGQLKSAIWDIDAPEYFKKSIEEMNKAIERSKIRNLFVIEELNGLALGNSEPGEFSHLHVYLTAEQFEACKLDHYTERNSEISKQTSAVRLLRRLTSMYSIEDVKKSILLLRTTKSVKFENAALELLNFMETYDTKNTLKQNWQLWKFITECHDLGMYRPKSMYGSVLEMIKEGCTDELIIDYIKANTGNTYMRPTAAVSNEMAIKHAEARMIEMGYDKSIERRIMLREEILPHLRWTAPEVETSVEEAAAPSMFGKLLTKKEVDLPKEVNHCIDISYRKLERDILPTALEIQAKCGINTRGAVCTYLTAVNPESKPLFKWDHHDSWAYIGGGSCNETIHDQFFKIKDQFTGNYYFPVVGIATDVEHWGSNADLDDMSKDPYFAINFIVDGIVPNEISSGLFPAVMKSELHEFRQILETYSNKVMVESEPNVDYAVGLHCLGLVIKVRDSIGWNYYRIMSVE